MGELAVGGGREIGLLRTKDGLILRRGRVLNGREVLDVSGATRVIAYFVVKRLSGVENRVVLSNPRISGPRKLIDFSHGADAFISLRRQR